MLMARKAREKVPFGTYLIEQSCIEDKSIFESDADRHKFLEVLLEKKSQFQFKIYGYCLADNQGYKLVLYDNGSDISKIMKSINISYAYRIRERGKVFSERYKSTLIKSPESLRDILDNIHVEKPCCDYKSELTVALLDADIYFTPAESKRERLLTFDTKTDEPCLDVNPSCKHRDDCICTLNKGAEFIEKAAQIHDQTVKQLLSDKPRRNIELLNLRKRSTLSLKQIGTLFGGLSESAVCKIISRNRKDGGN
jgi:REP element-mobilizing transposase RayT